MTVLIGTSGWHYDHWKHRFYPEGVRPPAWLGYYSQRFATVELNNAFYRLPILHSATAHTSQLVNLGYVGVIVFALSGLLDAGFHLVLAQGVGHVDPISLQAVNLLHNYFQMSLESVGVVLFLVATGIAVIRYRPLPVWLGWVAIVLAVLSIVVGVLGAGLWTLIASIVILIRAGKTGSAVSPVVT